MVASVATIVKPDLKFWSHKWNSSHTCTKVSHQSFFYCIQLKVLLLKFKNLFLPNELYKFCRILNVYKEESIKASGFLFAPTSFWARSAYGSWILNLTLNGIMLIWSSISKFQTSILYTLYFLQCFKSNQCKLGKWADPCCNAMQCQLLTKQKRASLLHPLEKSSSISKRTISSHIRY